jgi:hypothetical protein
MLGFCSCAEAGVTIAEASDVNGASQLCRLLLDCTAAGSANLPLRKSASALIAAINHSLDCPCVLIDQSFRAMDGGSGFEQGTVRMDAPIFSRSHASVLLSLGTGWLSGSQKQQRTRTPFTQDVTIVASDRTPDDGRAVRSDTAGRWTPACPTPWPK